MNIEKDFRIECLKIALHKPNGDCHENSKMVYDELIKLGYDVKLVNGYYIVNYNKTIRHSWLEYENKILETDPKQLEINSDLCAVLPKEQFKFRYNTEIK